MGDFSELRRLRLEVQIAIDRAIVEDTDTARLTDLEHDITTLIECYEQAKSLSEGDD